MKRNFQSLVHQFNYEHRLLNTHATRVRKSLSEARETLDKIAPNEDIKSKKEKNKKI